MLCSVQHRLDLASYKMHSIKLEMSFCEEKEEMADQRFVVMLV